MKNIFDRQAKGSALAIKALNEKISGLQKNHQDEKEDIRGFNEDGTSKQSFDKKEKEYLKSEIANAQKKINTLIIQKELNNLLSDATQKNAYEIENSDERDNKIFSQSSKEVETFTNEIAKQYERLGFYCEISLSKGEITKIDVKMPEGFEGKDPLKMSVEELEKAQEANKQQNSVMNEKPGTSPSSPLSSKVLSNKQQASVCRF